MVPLYVIFRAGITDSCRSRLDHGGGKDLSLPERPRERLEKEVRSLIASVATKLTSSPLDVTHAEDYVSEIRHSCRFTRFDATAADTSPQSNVGHNLLGRNTARSHTYEQD